MRKTMTRIQINKQRHGQEQPDSNTQFLRSLVKKSGVMNDLDIAMNSLGVKSIAEFMDLKDESEGESQWKTDHPLEILISLRRHFRNEPGWIQWEPEVLLKYAEEYMERPLAPIEKIKIQALQAAVTTDAPWVIYDVFENFCIATTGDIPTIGELEPLDIYQLGFGVGVLDAIRTETYDDSVRSYIAATLLNNGIVYLPGDIGLPDVNDILAQLTYGNDLVAVLIEQVKLEWKSGRRIKDPDSDVPVDQQVMKLDALKTWFDAGKERPV